MMRKISSFVCIGAFAVLEHGCAAGSAAKTELIRDAGADDPSGVDDHDGDELQVGIPDPSPDFPRVERVVGPVEPPPAEDPNNDEFPPEDPPSPPEDLDRDHDGVLNDNDCAPDDPLMHPGAVDVCGNDLDEDCDGADLICPPPPPPPPPPRDCILFVAREDPDPARLPGLLQLSSHFLCDNPCAVLIGEEYPGHELYPGSWTMGIVLQERDGMYTCGFSNEFPPGVYRISYAIPREGCEMRYGSVVPGGVCQDGGPWAGYRDGAEVCPENRNWVWCGDAPDGTGYTCSIMFRIREDRHLEPAGNR